MLTLWQAEWCPYSSRVREMLTEYGLDFVARQVTASRRDRKGMREAVGTDAIPVLVPEDGTPITEFQEIREHHDRPADADRHR